MAELRNEKLTMNRLTYLNGGWTSEGIIRRSWAKENKKCAYCGEPVPKGQRLYCSRKCSWTFFNDSRYHSKVFLWTRIRAEVLWENKKCQKCGHNPSSEVDHIKEIAIGGDPFDKANLQALCHQCHKKKTIRFLIQQMRARSRIGSRVTTTRGTGGGTGVDQELSEETPNSFTLVEQSMIDEF